MPVADRRPQPVLHPPAQHHAVLVVIAQRQWIAAHRGRQSGRRASRRRTVMAGSPGRGIEVAKRGRVGDSARAGSSGVDAAPGPDRSGRSTARRDEGVRSPWRRPLQMRASRAAPNAAPMSLPPGGAAECRSTAARIATQSARARAAADHVGRGDGVPRRASGVQAVAQARTRRPPARPGSSPRGWCRAAGRRRRRGWRRRCAACARRRGRAGTRRRRSAAPRLRPFGQQRRLVAAPVTPAHQASDGAPPTAMTPIWCQEPARHGRTRARRACG